MLLAGDLGDRPAELNGTWFQLAGAAAAVRPG